MAEMDLRFGKCKQMTDFFAQHYKEAIEVNNKPLWTALIF
jgi:hypothetical protein